jgi:prephenate dehydrogenase
MSNIQLDSVAIVGLGLMGGSFAKALQKYNLAKKIIGYDHNQAHQKEALRLNLVHKIATMDEILEANMILLCIPVDAIVSFMPKLIGVSPDTTIVDFGSTKQRIVQNIPSEIRSNFIPAHPMAGTEKFGPSAAIDGLYENKTMVLCDLELCNQLHKQRAIDIFKSIKMNIVYMDSATHDIHACYISHLPHAISFGLANTVMSHEDPKNIITLAAGGFKDMSRIAKSSPTMWSDIFKQNRNNLLDALQIYINHMQDVQTMLQDERYEDIEQWMKKANTLHDIL